MEYLNNVLEWVKSIGLEQVITVLIALGTSIFFFIFCNTFAYIIVKLFNFNIKSKEKIKANAFYTPLKIFFALLGVYIGIIILKLNADIMTQINKYYTVINIILLTIALAGIFKIDSDFMQKVQKRSNLDISDNRLNFFCKIIRVVIYIVAGLIIITKLGYNLTGIIAGLGVGGVILTLAAQDTAKNLFGGLMIIMDKPFAVGEWIQTTNFEGIVEDITFRSTRIRTWDNTLANIPNGSLANESIINCSKMEKRKYKLDIKIDLGTPLQTVKRVISKIYFMLINHPNVINDDTYVKFDEIKEDGINIMILVFTNSIDYGTYLNAKEKINENILEILEHENVKIAYRTTSVLIKNEEFNIRHLKDDKETETAN